MKKFLIPAIVFLFAFQISNAQTGKGNQTIGLDAGFSFNKSSNFAINPFDNSSSSDKNKTTSFNIGPDYSYFIADKLDIGASFNYNFSSITSTNASYPSKQTQNAYGGTIYLRKYIMYRDKIGIRVGPFAGYTRSDQKITDTGSNAIYNGDSKSDNFNVGASVALVYYPSKNLGVSATIAGLDYFHGKTDNGAQGNASEDALSFNFMNSGLAFSVFYSFGGK